MVNKANFTHSDVYNMPRGTRRFYYQKFMAEYNKTVEDSQQHNNNINQIPNVPSSTPVKRIVTPIKKTAFPK